MYIPNKKKISIECGKIRQNWTSEEEKYRRGGNQYRGYTFPQIILHHVRCSNPGNKGRILVFK